MAPSTSYLRPRTRVALQPAILITLCLGLLTWGCLGLSPSRVHAFYYLWYGTPEHDAQWQHWDHEVLPHWEDDVSKKHPEIGTRYSPPQDIHSPFYPAWGPYSSRDPDVIRAHLDQMIGAGIGVAVLSWWGHPNRTGTTDTQGVNTDSTLDAVFHVAEKQGKVQLAFHMEPYPGRTALSVRDDVEYLLNRFGQSKALFRYKGQFPVFYIYDSYLIESFDWSAVLSPSGAQTLRHSEYDGLFIGLWLENSDFNKIKGAHFDGAYSYFASAGMTYGSTWAHWSAISTIMKRNNLLFIPSVGPGYDDTLIRPWNRHNSKERRSGEYYREAWESALECDPDIVSITSFNEWGEGTQIEPAVTKLRLSGESYLSYGEDVSSSFYLDLTAEMCRAKASDESTADDGPRLMTTADKRAPERRKPGSGALKDEL